MIEPQPSSQPSSQTGSPTGGQPGVRPLVGPGVEAAPAARRRGRSLSLLARTGIALTAISLLIAATAVVALDRLVLEPMSERWAADEAGLFELAVRTWRQLPPDARLDFELELAERHDLIVSADERALAPVLEVPNHLRLLRNDLSSRLGVPVQLRYSDDLMWLDVPADVGGPALKLGFSANRRAIEPLSVAVVIVLVGAVIVFFGAFLIVQRVTRSLVRTAAAAVAFGGGRYFEPIPEEGPQEVRDLAHSFNTMAREITALIAHRTTFLAGVNHDLRTPLARVRVALELLPPDADPALVERISRSLEEMDELLSVALQYARGAVVERPERTALRSLIEPLLPARGVLDWRAEPDAAVTVAAGALRRVLQNLIANAERHGGDGTIEVEVKLRPARLRLAVRDRGPGIPVERQADVFQPFFRIEDGRPPGNRGPTRPGGGSGLGLAIVKQLCDAYGWAVTLRNREGGGTEAVVEVPLA
jgi:two-component system osmolarity sensor histidine kinase EnvZ